MTHADLGQRDDVHEVQLPIATAGKPMPGSVCAGHLDGCNSAVAGERGGSGEPGRMAAATQQPRGDDRTHAIDLEESSARAGHGFRLLSRERSDALIGRLDSTTKSRAGSLRAVSTGQSVARWSGCRAMTWEPIWEPDTANRTG